MYNMEPAFCSKRTFPIETSFELRVICGVSSGDQLNRFTARGMDIFRNAMKHRKKTLCLTYYGLWFKIQKPFFASPRCAIVALELHTHTQERAGNLCIKEGKS